MTSCRPVVYNERVKYLAEIKPRSKDSMDYLFFDTECSDGAHLCEFGYVVTGENGEVREKDVILVNPEHRFCLRGKEPSDIKLHFKPAVYYKAKPFGAAYARISGLLTAPDRMIFGHSLVNDAKFIRTACEDHDLAIPPFRYCDSQKLFRELDEEKRVVNLEKACEEMGVATETLHKSDDDALMTARLTLAIAEKTGMTPAELAAANPGCCGRLYADGTVEDDTVVTLYDRVDRARADENNRMNNNGRKVFEAFARACRPVRKSEKQSLRHKRVAFCKTYENAHLREMLSLVRLIAEAGGRYTPKINDCDFYVSDETGEDNVCTRCAGASGLKTLTTGEFLGKLGITREELEEMPFPENSDFTTREVGWWESTEKRRRYAAEVAERERRETERQNKKSK